MIASGPELEVKEPSIFTPWAVFTVSICGLILVIPVILSMMVVSVLHFGTLIFLIPLFMVGLATFFLPLGFGNPYVAKLARPLRPAADEYQALYLVQLTRMPRNRSGFLAFLEDADDIGFLCFSESALAFHGDSFRLKIPYECIEKLELRNAGWRAMFAYGPQTVFSVRGLSDAGTFAFAERASWHLSGSRKNALGMYRRLEQKIRP